MSLASLSGETLPLFNLERFGVKKAGLYGKSLSGDWESYEFVDCPTRIIRNDPKDRFKNVEYDAAKQNNDFRVVNVTAVDVKTREVVFKGRLAEAMSIYGPGVSLAACSKPTSRSASGCYWVRGDYDGDFEKLEAEKAALVLKSRRVQFRQKDESATI